MDTMIRVANAPCSWGVLEFEVGSGPAAFGQVLDEMAATGYAGTELGDWGFMPTEPGRLKEELGQRSLTLVGAFVPVPLVDPGAPAGYAEMAVRVARLLCAVGGPEAFVVLADANGTDPIRTQNAGRIQPEQGLTDAQWRTFAQGAEAIARAVRDGAGLRTVFHHHCAGFVETPAEVERLMALTDPGLLGLCLDTGHYHFGGGDALAALEQYGERVWHVHLKDHQPELAVRSRGESWDYFCSIQHGVFCELGQGDVDFAGVTNALRRRGYDGWVVVEQDVLPGRGTPQESAGRNRAYLRSIGL
jgi:inosose dehydratase